MHSRRLFFRFFSLPLLAGVLSGLTALGKAGPAFAAGKAELQGNSLRLPTPDKAGGLPLMQALARRASSRSFSERALSDQVLGDLLWAAWGVNRPNGKRTAPTARNQQRLALYAAMANGVWLYDGEEHALTRVLERDTRRDFGGAPLTLVYTAEDGPFGAMHLGALYQNVGLYCASAGLSNVVKATGVDVLKKELSLPGGYRIMIIQSVGWPG